MTSDNEQGSVTLATIAAHLGVSRSTVSNAYNHPDQLSPQLRERILETAATLGYTGPDPVARRLRQGRAGAIGVLFSEPLQNAFADPASVLFLKGVATATEEADAGMLLIPAPPSEETASVVTNSIVDGFILYSIPPGHPFVQAALARRLPVVSVDQVRIEGVAWLGIEDRKAARSAAEHLLQLGHRRIAVVVYGLGNDDTKDFPLPDPDYTGDQPSVSWLRLEGYGDAFRAAGLAWTDVTVRHSERNTESDGAAIAAELLDSDDPPTAILCTSDALAIGALDLIAQRGLDAPGDISVVGFNDLPAAEAANLTTVRQPLTEKGAAAARMLLDDVPSNGRSEYLAAELIVRSSSGPAPG